ncbi:helix-turn-helix domain-containing protein [Rhizobium leguminosarum]|uniref:helix-turn-helix domain-containing protein n=1 Tax=Rhizobium leguminosarum TaxID=384 RepID=UPI0009C49B5B|nr:hypothetical protein BS629_27890 [Rhizobium leguminosarum bv. viciae USDA 2370]
MVRSPFHSELGARIRLRQFRAMSQTELGKKSGVSFQRIQKHEIGSNRVSPSRLQKIADALGVSPATLFRQDTSANDGVPGGVKDLEAFIASAEGKELNEAFQRIGDTRIRKSVVTFVKSLAGAC